MDVPSLNFTSLRCLQEVERRGSFTDAAVEMGISQPALSHSLAELSRRLGAPLFRKAGRRRVLTEPGRRAARYADAVLGQTAELLRWIRGWERGEVGALRVGMIDTVGLYTLPSGLARLRREHAGIDLQLVVDDSGALLGMLDDYRIDLAFVVGPAGAAYHSAPVTTEGLHVYSPPGRAPDGWALYPSGSRTRFLVDQGLAQQGVRPRVALESANPTVLRQMAVLGYARTVLPRQVAEPGDVLSEGPRVAQRRIVGVWRADGELDPRVRNLLRLVTEG